MESTKTGNYQISKTLFGTPIIMVEHLFVEIDGKHKYEYTIWRKATESDLIEIITDAISFNVAKGFIKVG